MTFHPAHQVARNQPTDDRAQKTGANHIGCKTGRKARRQGGFICQRVSGIGRKDRHHQDAKHAAAELAIHPQPRVLLVEQVLQAQDLRQQYRHGQHRTAGNDQRHRKRDTAKERLLELGFNALFRFGIAMRMTRIG